MSAATASAAAKAPTTTDKNAEPAKDTKPAAALEEDDEFEDFPVESMLPPGPPAGVAQWQGNTMYTEALANICVMADWTQEETEVPGDNTHLWEESWDDDDTSEDFSAQLK